MEERERERGGGARKTGISLHIIHTPHTHTQSIHIDWLMFSSSLSFLWRATVMDQIKLTHRINGAAHANYCIFMRVCIAHDEIVLLMLHRITISCAHVFNNMILIEFWDYTFLLFDNDGRWISCYFCFCYSRENVRFLARTNAGRLSRCQGILKLETAEAVCWDEHRSYSRAQNYHKKKPRTIVLSLVSPKYYCNELEPEIKITTSSRITKKKTKQKQ